MSDNLLKQDKTKTKTVTRWVGNVKLTFTCAECEGEYLDTRVTINDDIDFCWISFADIDSFVSKLNEVVKDYSI